MGRYLCTHVDCFAIGVAYHPSTASPASSHPTTHAGVPPLPAHIQQHMPAWQQFAHMATQYSMYALFFIVPFVGWAYSSAAGYPVVVFGILPLPDFVTADKALAELIKPWHEISAFALAGLVGLHVAAALKHQFVDKHAMLQRILPVRHF